jgi:hypothetical protein
VLLNGTKTLVMPGQMGVVLAKHLRQSVQLGVNSG